MSKQGNVFGKKVIAFITSFAFVAGVAGVSVAFAALTFTGTAITGDGGTTLDVGAGNTLSLQTTNNGQITAGTGLFTITNASTSNSSTTNLDVSGYATVVGRFTFAAASSSGNVTIGGTFQSNAGQSTFASVSSTNLFASGYLTITGSSTIKDFTFTSASSTGNVTIGGTFQSNVGQNTFGNASATTAFTTAVLQATGQTTLGVVSSSNIFSSGYLNVVSGRSDFGSVSSTALTVVGSAHVTTHLQVGTVSSTNQYIAGYGFIIGNTNQTQNLLTLSSSSNQLFFTVSPMGVASSTEFRSPSSTIATLTVTSCTGCSGFTGVDSQLLFGQLGGGASSSLLMTFSSSTGAFTVGSSSLTNVSSTNLDVATRFNFAAASSTGNLTVGGLFQVAVTSTFSAAVNVKGHVNTTSTTATPGTPTTCGTSPSVVGTDNAFRVTVGTGAPVACTIPFGAAFKSSPICTITQTNTTTPLFFQASTTATNISINSLDVQTSTVIAKNMNQVVFNVACFGID